MIMYAKIEDADMYFLNGGCLSLYAYFLSLSCQTFLRRSGVYFLNLLF